MNWITYLLEANLYLVAFYILYVLFLRSETLYQLNRAYLLISSALAFVIPFMQLGVLRPSPAVTAQVYVEGLQGNFAIVADPAEAPKWGLEQYTLLIYGIIAGIFLIHLCVRIYLLMQLSRKGSVKKATGFKIIELHQGSVAFSFFNNLFIDDRLASSQTVLQHEQVHIRQKHSWDVMYFELLKIINWFNPVIYLMIASIKELHEFIADEQTVQFGNNNDAYTDFLISNAYGITQNPLTNSFFNKNLLKRRIIMLYQKKSGKAARLKYLLALPLMGGLLCLSTLAFTTKTYGFVDLVPGKAPNPAKILSSKSLPVTVIGNTKATTVSVPADTNKQHVKVTNVVLLPPPAIANNSQPSKPVKITNIVLSPPIADDNVPAKPAQIVNVTLSPPPTAADTNGIVFTAVEKSPQFPGGEAEFGKFLAKNVRYPKKDHDDHVQGRVYLNFIVEKDGSLSNIKVVRTPSATLGDESTRVLNLSPKWIPGLQNGKPVRVSYTIPINFSLAYDTTPPVASKVDLPEVNVLNTNNGNTVYTAVEVQPQFPGGQSEFGKFLMQTIRYPAEDKKNGVQGKVYVQFVIERDGSLTDIKVLRSPSDAISEEAVRVMKLSPKWTPGTQNGKPVRVQFTVPINFALGGK